MITARTYGRAVFALSILSFAAGCSALKVDVDVYKGPLANEEQVQIEQMAVMAIGAKPLLIELRDRLEWPSVGSGQERKSVKPVWYRRSFIPPKADGTSWLEMDQAIRVNGVLSLYENRGPEELGVLFQMIKRAFADYQQALYAFRPPDATTATAAWEKIVPWITSDGSNSKGAEPKEVKNLLHGYELLLQSNEYIPNGDSSDVVIFKAHKAIFGELNSTDSTLQFGNPELSKIFRDEVSSNNANLHFLALSNARMVRAHADLLFRKSDSQQENQEIEIFITRTLKVARAFGDAREALASMWRNILILCQLVGDEKYANLANRDECIYGAAQLIAEMTKYDKLVPVLIVAGDKDADAPLHVRGLRESLEKTLPKGSFDTSNRSFYGMDKKPQPINLRPELRECLEAALKWELAKRPRGTASALLEANTFFAGPKFAEAAEKHAGNRVMSAYKETERRQYGLVRGPTVLADADSRNNVAEIERGLKLITSGCAAGLEAGRLDEGLEELVEQYLRDSQGLDHDTDVARLSLENLMDELVRFSEKVLYIANNEVLLEGNSSGTYQETNEEANRYGEGMAVSNTSGTCQDGDENIKRYATVLQAVGNSILIQVDELRCRNKQRKTVFDRKASEVEALTAAYVSDPLTTLRSMQRAFESELDDKTSKLAQIDSEIARATTEKAEKETALKTATDEKTKLEDELRVTPENAKLQSLLEAKKKEILGITGRIKELDGYLKAREETQKNLALRIADLTTTVDVVKGYVTEWWAATAPDDRLSPRAAIEVLLMKMREARAIATDDAGKKNLDTAIAEVRSYQARVTVLGAISPKGANAKDVLDGLITALQYQYIQEVGIAGNDSTAAKNIAQAIEAAYAYRSGMVYIRPPSAYLRSSYPATSLQNDPQNAWRNMLDDQFVRGIPWPFGESWANKRETGQGPKERKIVAEIDKQFWQNINSVRVAGAGITNYVIAKDDIGNWYVKSYAADPTPILESAKNLAMYNMGERMAADLLDVPAKAKDAAKAAGTTVPGETTLQRLFRKYRAKYDEQTKKDYDALAALLKDEKIPTDIKTAWDADTSITDSERTTLKKTLDGKKVVLKEAADGLSKDMTDSNRGTKIVDALNSIKRFHSVLSAEIGKIPEGSGNNKVQKGAREAGQQSAMRIVKDTLTKHIEQRKATIKEYETAIMFIGEATRPAEAGAAAKKPEAATGETGT